MRRDEPYAPPLAAQAASHFCSTTGATVYCDAVDCSYCGQGDDESDGDDGDEEQEGR